MASTKYKISEQIIRLLKGSDQPAASSLEQPEVQQLVGQVINRLLKIESYEILNDRALTGDIIPTGLVIATYEDVAVTTYKTNYASCTLPAVPVRLPKGMGVFHIGGVNDPFTSYIPIPAGLHQMISEEPLISDLLGQIGYEVYGNLVVFTRDITVDSPAVENVMIRLVVMDVSQLDERDPLPIPASMEADVITEVLKIFGVQAPPDNKVDPVSETKQTK